MESVGVLGQPLCGVLAGDFDSQRGAHTCRRANREQDYRGVKIWAQRVVNVVMWLRAPRSKGRKECLAPDRKGTDGK